jgi:hypothetical protein
MHKSTFKGINSKLLITHFLKSCYANIRVSIEKQGEKEH